MIFILAFWVLHHVEVIKIYEISYQLSASFFRVEVAIAAKVCYIHNISPPKSLLLLPIQNIAIPRKLLNKSCPEGLVRTDSTSESTSGCTLKAKQTVRFCVHLHHK
jgi:hypothetical protein